MKGIAIDKDKLRERLAGKRVGSKTAAEIGITPPSLYRKLSGALLLTLEDVNRICKVQGWDTKEFLREIEESEIERAA